MTHSLPENANLDWLKKTAKQLLRQWRAEGRDAKLADAQLFLARDHGFSSWRSMRQAIEARAAEPPAYQPDNVENPNDRFLRLVGRGDLEAIGQALRETPGLVNVVAAHPFWGGRPQPLHVAVETNRHDVFEFLLDAGADPNGENRDYDNWSPLMLASSRRRSAMIDVLVDKGATIGLCEALLMADDEKNGNLARRRRCTSGNRPTFRFAACPRAHASGDRAPACAWRIVGREGPLGCGRHGNVEPSWTAWPGSS